MGVCGRHHQSPEWNLPHRGSLCRWTPCAGLPNWSMGPKEVTGGKVVENDSNATSFSNTLEVKETKPILYSTTETKLLESSVI